MKVQISDIEPSVWRRARVAALGAGHNMGQFIGTAVTVYLDGIVKAPKVAQEPRKQPKVASGVLSVNECPPIPSKPAVDQK